MDGDVFRRFIPSCGLAQLLFMLHVQVFLARVYLGSAAEVADDIFGPLVRDGYDTNAIHVHFERLARDDRYHSVVQFKEIVLELAHRLRGKEYG